MDREQMKAKVIAQVDKDREAILALGAEIYKHPETGYREVRTTETVAKALEGLGLPVDRGIAVTGCRAHANTEKTGPKVVVMGELDSVVCPNHPDCDPETGAMHACGHNIQVSVMYGVAAALIHSGVIGELDGKLDFMAVPAEEYIEMDYRKSLRDQGKLHFYGGKVELAYKGAFDDVDMVMMAHNFPIAEEGYKVSPMTTGNGFIGKKTHFLGKQAHAGAAPWDGVNALNMATIAINSMHAQRETFRERDYVRLHQIINRGGDIVNAVPDDVELETTLRARTLEALKAANVKVNRCIQGAAIAMGGHATVEDSVGYLPMNPDKTMAAIFTENAKRFYPEETILPCMDSTGSFDIGDLSHFMPILHCITSGVTGGLHSADYRIVDLEDAFITPVKMLACTVIDLLCDGAAGAKEVKDNFKPVMTKAEYVETILGLEQKVEY